ncbi:hypothetical protein ACS0TY_030698 [Phlomoides rotata]
MGDPPSTSSPSPPSPPPPPPNTLVKPSPKKKHKPVRVLRAFRNVFRSFPIITPVCKLPSLPGGLLPDGKSGGTTRVTGTIFGYRKGRASLSIQQNPRTLPMMVLELAMHTHVLQKELGGGGMVRIALECDKPPVVKDKSCNLLEEPVWTMFSNGKKNGYGVRREATEEDLHVMEVLKAMSMGTGVLPPRTTEAAAEGDGEMTYMRWQFERVVGSKDSETLYMISPNGGGNGPDLSIFFVRI